MTPRARWGWGGLIAVTALGVGSAAGVRALGPSVRYVATSRREVVEVVVASGRVLPPARITVGSQVAGVAKTVGVSEGDHVRVGELLVALDDAEPQAALVTAQAGLEQARAKLAQLQHIASPMAREAHRQADSNLAGARVDYERAATLAKDGSVPRAELEEAKRALDVAKSKHAASETQAAGMGPQGADHALAIAAHSQAAASVAQAEVRLRQSRITAAVAATVLSRSVEPGELVQPGRALFVLARDGETWLTVSPDEKNLAELRLGQRARASADAFPKEAFDATLSYLAPSIDPQRGTVEVRFAVGAPPAYLRTDMTVSVDVEVGRHPNALVVPSDAVQGFSTPKPWVWLLRDGRAERRDVLLGLHGDGYVEVLAGTADGDLAIVPAGVALTNGQHVRATARANN